MVLQRKPSVLFAFLEMRFMCVSHDRCEEMSTQDILLKIQIPVCTCEEYTVWNWVFGPCYVNDLAFRGVKFHVSFMTQAFKVVKIFLENLWLGRC